MRSCRSQPGFLNQKQTPSQTVRHEMKWERKIEAEAQADRSISVSISSTAKGVKKYEDQIGGNIELQRTGGGT